jgi:hypothetical protein
VSYPNIDDRLGAQLWVERDDTPERIRHLVSRLADCGMGHLRIFLMWPWIQADSPTTWDWAIWDEVFDASEAHGVKVKATLTSNSGPWWLGTPSVLHSATLTLSESWRAPQEAYIRAAVDRYRTHPALAQWILWNEPGYPLDADPVASRPVGAKEAWLRVLADTYGNVDSLNRRWRTGYLSFQDVPFLESIVHPAHRDWYWHSWAPYRDDAVLRARLIEEELSFVADIVRQRDPETPLCINPNKLLNNHAHSGVRLAKMASLVNTMGASFHAPWVFATFADVDDHTALIVQGLRLLQHTPGSHTCEVTEAQTGNTFYAGANPIGVGRGEIASTYLAPILAGATSVTGWCFNTRHDDFEAGEWGLLNDDDTVSDRAEALPMVRDCLSALDHHLGQWEPQSPTVGVILSPTSHAHQYALSQNTHTPVGSNGELGVQASALAAVELERLGLSTTLIDPAGRGVDSLDTLIALHQNALSVEEASALLDAASAGATVIIDGTTGQFDDDSTLYRPWPGVWSERTGLVASGLDTAVEGSGSFQVFDHAKPSGELVGVRSRIVLSEEWVPRPRFTWADSGRPVTSERPWGEGRLVYSTAALAPSLHRGGVYRLEASKILTDMVADSVASVRPLSPHTSVIALRGEKSCGWAVFAPPRLRRRGNSFHVSMEPGHYVDVWSGVDIVVGADRVATLDGEDGIAVLIPRSPSH